MSKGLKCDTFGYFWQMALVYFRYRFAGKFTLTWDVFITLKHTRNFEAFSGKSGYNATCLCYTSDQESRYIIVDPQITFCLTLSQTSPGFNLSAVQVIWIFENKNLWEEKLLVTTTFSFSHSVFYAFWELSATFMKFEIVVYKLFQFERWWDLSFGKVWWHISATRYEIPIMIIFENYRDKTNFPGNSIEIAKCFTIKISRYF